LKHDAAQPIAGFNCRQSSRRISVVAQLSTLGGKRMTKTFLDFVSFAVMATLIFVVVSLSFTSVTGSSGAGIRFWDLHWIVVRQDVWNTSLSHIYTGTLAALIALSLGLTWVLSKLLKVLHAKKSDAAWLFFIVVIVIYFLAATVPNFVFT
jgi:hypothetical protein